MMAIAAPETTSLIAFTLPSIPYSVQMARFYIRAALACHELGEYAEDAEAVTSDSLNLSVCSCCLFCCFSGCGLRGSRGLLWCLDGG
jgi:hypothetical protein